MIMIWTCLLFGFHIINREERYQRKLSSLLTVQIIIDIVFFIIIVILLRQLRKRLVKDPPIIDESIVREFKRLMTDSQDFTNHFLRVVEDNEQRLNKLSRQLDNKEKTLIILIEKAETLINKHGFQKETTQERCYSDEERSKHIVQMLKEGRSREEVMKRSGVTEGE